MACKKNEQKTETPVTEAQIPGVEALDDQEVGQVSGGYVVTDPTNLNTPFTDEIAIG